jgi:uncharacterized membrane protein
MGLTGGFYRLMLLLHIACAMLGFGAVAFNGFYRLRARRRGGEEEAAVLDANGDVSRIAEILIYAAFVFGILVVATSRSEWKFSQSWLSGAMLLYLIDIGVLHGLIRRTERQYATLLHTVNGAGRAGPGGGVAELERLDQRIRLGWAIFDVIFLLILFMMVFTPGHVRIG